LSLYYRILSIFLKLISPAEPVSIAALPRNKTASFAANTLLGAIVDRLMRFCAAQRNYPSLARQRAVGSYTNRQRRAKRGADQPLRRRAKGNYAKETAQRGTARRAAETKN
jgi:hypothetical protein